MATTLGIPTFLGNHRRNFYGAGPAPSRLQVIWKAFLGGGKTSVKGGFRTWYGCGWTGQPLIVEENGRPYVLIGAYDHSLRKIDGLNGKVIWRYQFEDVIKATGTIYSGTEDLIVLQGSRKGNSRSLASKTVPSFRAISYSTGKEVWRMNIPRTASHSRDVDGSALVLGQIAYLGAENGVFYIIDVSSNYPKVLKQITLYNKTDISRHGGDLTIESSPALSGNQIIVTAGSGHVFGIDKHSWEIVWDFYIGADLNGSPVVTRDGCVLVSVEKQYIPGQGGVFMLDPQKKPDEAVKWYFPVKNSRFADWKGGVIGSPAINDYYNDGRKPALAAFSAIDGNLYVVFQSQLSRQRARGPNLEGPYPMPETVFQCNIGRSISTPIFIGDDENDWLIAAGYNGVFLFQINYGRAIRCTLLDHFAPGVSFEATPVVWKGRVYIGSRNGWFYCLGTR